MQDQLSYTDLAKLHKSCFETPRPWSETEFAGLLSMKDIFLVSKEGPSFALGRVVAGEAELLTLAVAPIAQRKGLGLKILIAFETRAQELGADVAFLEVAENNTAAIKLYENHDYTESGRRRAYYSAPDGSKIDARLLTKALIRA